MCMSMVHEERAVGERVGEEKGRVVEEMVKVVVEDTHQVHALQSMKPRLRQWPLPLR